MKKQYALQTARKLTNNAIFLAIAALAICVWSAVTPADGCIATTTWTDGTGSLV